MNDLNLAYLQITNICYECRLMFCMTHARWRLRDENGHWKTISLTFVQDWFC